MLGTLASLSLMAIGLGRLAWLASRAEVADRGWADLAAEISRTLELCRPVELLQSDHPTLLVTWGFRRPKVILPASARTWSADRRRVVLLHELAHVRRGDWLTQMTAECLRAAYWFNPLVWLASRRLRQESEHACDDAVLSGGVEGSEYATHLLELARLVARERRPWFSGYPAPAMARPSSLERRFSAMLNGHLNRHPMTRPARLTTTIAVAVLTVLIAGLGAAQTFSTFSGTVFDSTNRVIPKVTLTLINAQSQAKYSIQSDPTGRFEFVGLPRGEYQFEVTGMGFTTLKGTVMVAGGNVQRNLALEIGSLQETITVAASPAAPSPDRTYLNVATRGSHDPGPCTVAATGGNIRPPRKVRDVRPLYPDHLRIAATGGVVTLEARIGGDGYVSEARVASSTHPDLDAAAVEAVQGWEFTSTLLNCDPVEVNMKVTVNFVIRP
jgi:TonB family protein